MTIKHKSLFLIITGLLLPAFAFALVDPGAVQSIYNIIQRINKFLLVLAIPLCVIIILWAAFTFATSGGDTTKTGNAKKFLSWGIIGLIVILLSNGFVPVLGNMLGIKPPGPASMGINYLEMHGIKDINGFYAMLGGKYNPETNEFIDEWGSVYTDVSLLADGSVEVCGK